MKNKKKILLLLIVSMLCLLFMESLVRFEILPFPGFVNSDEWWEERWLRNIEIIGDNKISYYPIDKFHPVLGWTLKENLTGVNIYGGNINSNSAGIRGKKEYPIEKQNRSRILVIGDSVTFGECVDDDETFSAYLDSMDEGIEVINMGVHGYGTDQQLLKLKIQGLEYNPDIVILGFFDDDFSRNIISFRDYAKPKFTLLHGNLTLTNVPVKTPEEYKKEIRVRILNHLKILKDRWFPEENEESEIYALSYRLLEEIIEESQSINATSVFVYLPEEKEAIINKSEPSELFYDICNEKNITCIDPAPRICSFLLNKKNPEDYFNSHHYGPKIHRLIAEEIYKNLMPILKNVNRN